MKNCLLVIVLQLLFTPTSIAQNDSSYPNAFSIFERITRELKNYKPDTSAVPNDKLTKRITVLRNLGGGFNINEAIAFKIAEEQQNNNITVEEAKNLATYFKTGNGSRWLNNAIVWIYRNQFSSKEIKKLIKFYRSSTGKKMASAFPMLMLQSLAAGEAIKAMYDESIKQK